MSEITVRVATIADVAAVTQLGMETLQFHYEQAPEHFLVPEEPAIAEFTRRVIADPEKHVFVATIEDIVRGYTIAVLQRREPNPFNKARLIVEIDQLGVDPEFESRGVGTALTRRSIQLADEVDADSMRLTVWTFNGRAERLYARHGFATVMHQMRRLSPS